YAAGIWSDERGTNLGDAGTPYYGVYATLDEKHMAVGALEPKFYAEFMRLLGLPLDPAAQSDPAAWPQLKTHISDAFAARTQREWMTVFEGSDACVAPVLGLADAPEHPHLAARGTFFASDGVTQPAPAPRFSRNGGRPVMRTRRTHRGNTGRLAELRFLRLALGTEPPNQS
ncbi:MAG: alpha-methylacyl-CoA racemase, partial [Mycobacterium sp.]|nr:alpha-methylacyl-CoA racemase [Mycobacterium sp.]